MRFESNVSQTLAPVAQALSSGITGKLALQPQEAIAAAATAWLVQVAAEFQAHAGELLGNCHAAAELAEVEAGLRAAIAGWSHPPPPSGEGRYQIKLCFPLSSDPHMPLALHAAENHPRWDGQDHLHARQADGGCTEAHLGFAVRPAAAPSAQPCTTTRRRCVSLHADSCGCLCSG